MKQLMREVIPINNFLSDRTDRGLHLIPYDKDALVAGDKIKIILADNRASNRRGLKALLAFEPRISVIGEASDGREALQLVTLEHPDLVLMDIQMPHMDGLHAARQIKSSWPDVKVILYTMYPGYEEEAMQAGADYFMIKGSPGEIPSEIILSFFPREV
jgi:DNA-binding NarL/FixJ family response regulator